MARGGRAAAGFWMIQRQKETGLEPFNPYNLPVVQVGNAALFYTPAASLAFSLFLSNGLDFDLSVSMPLNLAYAPNTTYICGGGGE